MRVSFLAILGLAAVLGGSSAAPATATAKEIEALVQDGKLDEAVEKGRAAVGALPDDVDLRLATARALAAKARRFNHVVNVQLTQADLDKGQIKLPAGKLDDTPLQVAYDAGMFEEAILDLDEGIKRAPKREDLRVFKCFLLTDAARIDRAKVAIQETLDALPRTEALAKTMTAYAAERTKRHDPEGGAALLAPVAAAFPDSATVLVDYGNILTRLNRKKEADAAFDRATRLKPADVRFARTRATAAMLLKDYKRAQGAFDSVFRLSRAPEDQFASCVAAYGIDPKASAALMRDLALPSPAANAAVDDLANAFAVAGSAGPASPTAMSLAHRLVDGKQLVLAIPVLDRAVQADPKLTEAKTMLAKVFTDLGCDELAESYRK